MRGRRIALPALAAAAAGVIWWRRRSRSVPGPPVQLGLRDGSVHTLDPADPATVELQALAAGVRDSFPGGA